MMEHGRENNKGPAGRTEQKQADRNKVINRRDEQLDEELRGQLRRKNEENRKHMNDRTGQDDMGMDM